MLNVTLVRLAPDARSADVTLGQGGVMELSTEEFSARLEAFRELDPLQNAHADPEIRVQAGSQKYVVRTGQGKLFLYNVRDHTQPAQILTTEEVLAELDGSAQAARTAAPFPGLFVSQFEAPPEAEEIIELPPPRRPEVLLAWVAGVLALLALATFVGLEWMKRAHALPPAEAAVLGESVEGVYVSGSAAERGVVLGRDGAVRFFEARGDEPPAIAFDTWRATRENGAVRVSLVDRQTAVEVINRDTITIAGETYRRAMPP
jgi:hypothetical protein